MCGTFCFTNPTVVVCIGMLFNHDFRYPIMDLFKYNQFVIKLKSVQLQARISETSEASEANKNKHSYH